MTPAQRTLVSLAGPAANLRAGGAAAGATRLFFDPMHLVLWAGVAFLGFLQVTAVLLNLLPIPGLDGYDALEPHLSPETQRALAPVKQWGFLILLFLLLAPGAEPMVLRARVLVRSTCPGCRTCWSASAAADPF